MAPIVVERTYVQLYWVNWELRIELYMLSCVALTRQQARWEVFVALPYDLSQTRYTLLAEDYGTRSASRVQEDS